MARASKFTDEQRLEIALDMLSGKMAQPIPAGTGRIQRAAENAVVLPR